MFESCANLEKVKLSNNTKSIGKNAFYHCKNLKFLEIPPSVTYIGDGAFKHCNKDFKVKCENDSYAMEYCKNHNIPTC